MPAFVTKNGDYFPCKTIDIAPDSARIDAVDLALPEQFVLLLTLSRNIRRRSRLMWRSFLTKDRRWRVLGGRFIRRALHVLVAFGADFHRLHAGLGFLAGLIGRATDDSGGGYGRLLVDDRAPLCGRVAHHIKLLSE